MARHQKKVKLHDEQTTYKGHELVDVFIDATIEDLTKGWPAVIVDTLFLYWPDDCNLTQVAKALAVVRDRVNEYIKTAEADVDKAKAIDEIRSNYTDTIIKLVEARGEVRQLRREAIAASKRTAFYFTFSDENKPTAISALDATQLADAGYTITLGKL